ncbi:MAG: class I SAM-dependent methyltransferase [Proteobacteria bacterium]|nr:class I SAM-dependent methyltransferase [Pseudomonadota bacterium]
MYHPSMKGSTRARLYDVLDLPFEYGRYRRLRRLMFEGLSGRLLDAGVGTGRNIAFYPDGGEVTGIDLSPAMIARARRRSDRLGRAVDLLQRDVSATAFADNHFDAVIATFLFCVLEKDQQLPALMELARICREGGEIRLLDYVYSENPVRRFVMRLWAPWVRAVFGAAFDRDTERYVAAAGLELLARRFLVSDVIRLLVLRPKA